MFVARHTHSSYRSSAAVRTKAKNRVKYGYTLTSLLSFGGFYRLAYVLWPFGNVFPHCMNVNVADEFHIYVF